MHHSSFILRSSAECGILSRLHFSATGHQILTDHHPRGVAKPVSSHHIGHGIHSSGSEKCLGLFSRGSGMICAHVRRPVKSCSVRPATVLLENVCEATRVFSDALTTEKSNLPLRQGCQRPISRTCWGNSSQGPASINQWCAFLFFSPTSRLEGLLWVWSRTTKLLHDTILGKDRSTHLCGMVLNIAVTYSYQTLPPSGCRWCYSVRLMS
ncbi:hypothetical protein EDD36DRAFT_45250 [Exophiala viscosa]|uniref:Uncharacterized protein n=1 Tax=Exophiala viscosa TaxID=2486360 RepID=A0AAN6E7Z8_9EURO|nr:hypothetical protein EDD36DRAFT_45250 [Exophiala viscosa]